MVAALGQISALAQSVGLSKFPVPYGPTNTGKEFWLSFPANWEYAAGQKYVRLYITAGTKTKVEVWTGSNLLKTVTTVPYDVVTVDVPQFEAQVFLRNDGSIVPPDQIYTKKAMHIVSEAPIVVYGINRTTATSDGMLVLPVNGLGREYIVASARDISDGNVQKLPSQYMIISPYDNTQVTVINSSKTPNHGEGELVSFTMNKGDVYSAMSIGFNGDLSGSWISASKPIAVTAGQNCTYLPDQTYPACDHLCEMMLPISSWGKFYHSVPYANRTKGDLYRVFAGEDEAKVYLNGSLYGTLARKGGPEGIGWLQILQTTREVMEFTSDKPIYVAQYNNSQTYDNAVQTDPFYLVLSPLEQYQKQLVFTTPADDFPQNYINLVVDSVGFYSIEIAPGGTEKWEKLWRLKGGDFKVFRSKINGKKYVGKQFEIAPGTYRMRGDSAFAGYIYGFGFYDSYGYPLSVAVGDLSKPLDKDAPIIAGEPDCFGTVTGTSATVTDLPYDDNVRSNLSSIELDYSVSDNYKLDVQPFEAGIYQATTYTLTVIDRKKDAIAVIVASDMVGNVSRDTVRYTAFNVTVDPNPLDLGSLIIGEKKTGTAKITNNSNRAVTILETKLMFGDRGFTLLSPTTPYTLGPLGSGTESMDAQIEFTATKSGTFKDSLGVRDNCGLRYLSEITVKVGKPVIKVSDWDFRTVRVNSTAQHEIEISNAATDAGVLEVYSASGPTDNVTFKLPNGLPAFPLKVNPGQRVQVQVTFTPTADQAYVDTIFFTHNAPPNPENDSIGVLNGKGTKSDLTAEGADWKEKRVQKGPFYGHRIVLKNAGSAPIRIIDTLKTTGDINDFRIVSNEEYLQKTIPGNDSLEIFNIWFNPTTTGPRAMDIYFSVDPPQPTDVVAPVIGKGVVPGLVTSDLTWPPMLIGDPEVPMTVKFSIPTDHLFYDTVHITQFLPPPAVGGKNDFRIAGNPPSITLDPDGTREVSFTVYFQAKAAGTRRSEVRALTADNVDTASHLTGEGFGTGSPTITGTGGSVSGLCVPDSAEIIAVISNADTAQANLDITKLELVGGSGFTIVDPVDPNAPFTLLPGQSREIHVKWVAMTSGAQSTTLRVHNNDPAQPGRLDLTLSGSTGDIVAKAHVELKAEHAIAEFGKNVIATVIVDTATFNGAPVPINTKNYTVRMRYNPEEFRPRTDSIRVLRPSGATVVANVLPSTATESILEIVVTSTTAVDSNGALLTVPFGVIFMPDLNRAVSAEVKLNDLTCASIATTGDSIDVQPVCGMNLRLIERISNIKYALGQNSPNPFNPTTTIPYSLGLDGRTQVLLRNAAGELVQVVLDEYQEPGRYELTLDVTALPSGTYYYTVTSGTWSETRRMNVVK
jgi:hypothetical protein